jgi:hypothetical protein
MFSCPSCDNSSDVEFTIEHDGPVLICEFCGIAMPVVLSNPDTKEDIAEKVAEEPITDDEAWKIAVRLAQDITMFTFGQKKHGRGRRQLTKGAEPTLIKSQEDAEPQ